jgi:AAA family ATP:ADP antiporter
MHAANSKKSEQVLAGLLRPFAKVEPREATTVLILSATVFLLLTAYYLLKTAREPLILLGGGAEVKSYAAGGQAFLLLGFIRIYRGVAERVGRLALLVCVYLFFASNLLVFAALTFGGFAIGVPFYLWVGVFNYTSIAQFWAFAADVYSPTQGKRLFAVLGIGSSLGAVLGARVARRLADGGPETLMLGAAGLLIVCVLLVVWADHRARAEVHGAHARNQEPLSTQSALTLLARDRFLLLLAALTLLLNWVNTNGEYILDRTLLASLSGSHAAHAAATAVARFKADYFSRVNLVGVVLQLFVVSRVLTLVGPRVALFFLPVVAFGGYAVLFAAPVLALIRIAKIAENSIDYSIQNTVRQALYLVANREEKYVGKTVVDSLFVRLGDVLSAVTVWVGVELSLATSTLAALNLMLLVVVLLVVVLLGREHRRRSGEPSPGVASPLGSVSKAVVGSAALLLFVLRCGDAFAGPPPDRSRRLPPPKRELPDYDGRGGDSQQEDGAGTWTARITLAPIYAVWEYGVRRPWGATVAGAERAGVPATLYDFFAFGPDHKAGIVPVAFVDFGFKAAVGVYAFWNDAFLAGHDLQFHGTTGGADWLAGVLSERFPLGRSNTLTVRLGAIRRPDLLFYGLGPDTPESNRSRFGETRLAANARLGLPLWRSSHIDADVGVRSVALHHGHFAGEPSLEEQAATGAFAIPYGFDRGYTALGSRLSGVLDTRKPRPFPGSGYRLQLEVEEDSDVRRPESSTWLRYGASAGGFVDLNDRNRVLGVTLMTEFVDPLLGEVPFTELVALGGEGPMPGYRAGRLVDRSAAVATVDYHWPIWVWLDGMLQASAGNVFGTHLESFRANRIRFSGAVGVESVTTGGTRDGAFQILLGVATETIGQGTKVDSVRLALGTGRGY